jgi:hypothetical protein
LPRSGAANDGRRKGNAVFRGTVKASMFIHARQRLSHDTDRVIDDL